MGKKPEFVSIGISAWSLKARFALKHCGVQYKTTPYMPILGEFSLRLRLCKWGGKLTVPVMFTPRDGVLLESLGIAKWAAEHPAKALDSSLFPAGMEDVIDEWNRKSDIVLGFGRIALVDELWNDTAAIKREVPPGMRFLGPVAVWLTRVVIKRLRYKYEAEGSASLEQVLQLFRETQAALKSSKAGYLVGDRFTYADIAMAVAVMVLKPLGPPFTSKPRPGLPQFEALAGGEFADLVAWRDRIFTQHFPMEETKAKKDS